MWRLRFRVQVIHDGLADEICEAWDSEDRLVMQSTRQAIEQAMSAPQHIGDLILPCPFGHLETCTDDPSSFWIVSFTSGASHSPQVALTDIPQVGQA